jgi:phosphocarrier protein
MVQLAAKFQSAVVICANGQQVNGKSIMGILTLGAVCNTPLALKIDGPDATEAMAAFEDFLAKQED